MLLFPAFPCMIQAPALRAPGMHRLALLSSPSCVQDACLFSPRAARQALCMPCCGRWRLCRWQPLSSPESECLRVFASLRVVHPISSLLLLFPRIQTTLAEAGSPQLPHCSPSKPICSGTSWPLFPPPTAKSAQPPPCLAYPLVCLPCNAPPLSAIQPHPPRWQPLAARPCCLLLPLHPASALTPATTLPATAALPNPTRAAMRSCKTWSPCKD